MLTKSKIYLNKSDKLSDIISTKELVNRLYQTKVIEVKNLVKRYGNHLAVDHLSFKVEKGQKLLN